MINGRGAREALCVDMQIMSESPSGIEDKSLQALGAEIKQTLRDEEEKMFHSRP